MAKNIVMECIHCKENWEITKMAWWFTSYRDRVLSPLFKCPKCGSQGKKIIINKKEKKYVR